MAWMASFRDWDNFHSPWVTSYPKKVTFEAPIKDFFIFNMTPNSAHLAITLSNLLAASS